MPKDGSRDSSPFAPLLTEAEWELIQLKYDLDAIATGISEARANDDRQAVQVGLIRWLEVLAERLRPLIGGAALRPVQDLAWIMEAAYSGKPHNLTARQIIPIRKDSPARQMLISEAVAILHYFCGRPGANKGKIAKEIGAAMGRGGFFVSSKTPQPPSGRTVQAWLPLYISRGPTNRRQTTRVAKDLFNEVLTRIKAGDPTGERSEVYFKQCLGQLTKWCLDEAPVTASASPSTLANSE